MPLMTPVQRAASLTI